MHTILRGMMYATGQGKPQRMHFRAQRLRARTGSNREGGGKKIHNYKKQLSEKTLKTSRRGK